MSASIPLRAARRHGGDRSIGALLERIGSGDRDAFAALFDRLSPSVLAVARRRRETDLEAAELVQQVFLRLWRSAPRFPRQDLPAEVWVVSLVDETVGDAGARSTPLPRTRSPTTPLAGADGRPSRAREPGPTDRNTTKEQP